MTIRPTQTSAQTYLREGLGFDVFAEMRIWVDQETHPGLRHSRESLKSAVETFLNTSSDALSITDLDITELPTFFLYPAIRNKLRSLTITRTHLEELPEWIGRMKRLEALELDDNFHLNDLPESIGKLQRLRKMSLTFDRELSELQEFVFPATFRDLHLTELQIMGIDHIKILPLLRSQVGLRTFSITNSELDYIPREILGLRNLISLDLSTNDIEEIPNEIRELTELQQLDLRHNAIQRINTGVFDLDSGCEVLLQENFLDANELLTIDARLQAEEYRGPGFTTDREPYIASEDEQAEENEDGLDVQQEMTTFYQSLGLPLPSFIQELTQEEAKILGALLHQLQERIALSHSFAPKIYSTLADCLSLFSSDAQYRKACLQEIDGATRTCGDGVIAIILKLSLQRKEVLLKDSDPSDVLRFLMQGKLALSILEEKASLNIASKKIDIMHAIRRENPLWGEERIQREALERYDAEIDPVEVYLVFPIKLKQRLGLEIELDQMFFAASAEVSAAELDEAAVDVQQRLADKSFAAQFLIEQDLWIQVLQKQFPEAFQELEAKLERIGEVDCSGGEDPYVAYQQEKRALLIDLTRQVMDSIASTQKGRPSKRSRLSPE